LATGRLEHIIDRVFVGLEQAQAAHEYMESNANVGKIVLKLA
jgi:tumor protein p53-inducible protein 3